jgi:hypothetical protein
MYQLTGEGWRGWGGWGGWEEDIGLERWDRFNPCRHTDFPPYQHKVVLISLSIWTTVEQTGGGRGVGEPREILVRNRISSAHGDGLTPVDGLLWGTSRSSGDRTTSIKAENNHPPVLPGKDSR